jgi:nicotinate-nucleotide adenylyltransferase
VGLTTAGGRALIGILGGTFNPPHNGHVALARTAKERFGFEDFVVLVAANPGHKRVEVDAGTRLRLAEAAFPDDRVERDEEERTVDTLRTHDWDDPLFLIGADEFCDFLSWKDPDGVLAQTRLGVATRPGYPSERLEHVLARLASPERVLFFEIEPLPISSEDLRARVARGEDVSSLVPPAVAGLISELGLYRGYTAAEREDLTTR